MVRYTTDADRRMLERVKTAGLEVYPRYIEELSRKHFPEWIERLKKAETETRATRKRLEALLNEEHRECEQCGNAVTGRPDRRYCSSNCRLRAHRKAKRLEPLQPDSVTSGPLPSWQEWLARSNC